ncbi:MAG TPA: YfhO family protein [Thermoanaerobaculia bacterium]|nr:YfhO family protein [Thermoanaerobaculia bacterium]
MISVLATLAVFLAGAAALIAALRWWRRDLELRDAALYVALTTAFFAPPLLTGALQVPTDIAYETLPWREAVHETVTPRNRLLWDTLVEQVPFHSVARTRLLALEAPLWSHEMGTGQPLLGDAQSAPFAPLHLLALPLPPLRALSVSAAWEVLLRLLLVHALALALGARRAGAAFAAVAAGLSSHAVVWAYDTPGMTAAWIPGVFLGLVALARGEQRAAAGLVACAVGMAASGHPETLAHTALAAALVAPLLARGMARKEIRQYALQLAAAVALAAALAAPVLLPFVESLPRSARVQVVADTPEHVRPPPFEARVLAPLLDPFRFGSPRDDNWDGPENFAETCGDYCGLASLALALAGAALLRGQILALVLGGLASLAVALRVPPFFDLFGALPLFGQAANGRLRQFWVLAVALAAGLTLSRLAESAAARRSSCALAAAAGVSLALLPPLSPVAPWQRAWWLTALVAAFLTAGLLALPRRLPWVNAALLAALTADLFLAGVRYHAAVPSRFDLGRTPALTFLAERLRAAPAPFRVTARNYDLLPNLGAFYGLWDPRGNDPMRPAEPFRLLRHRLSPGKKAAQLVLAMRRTRDKGLFDFLGVRYLLLEHDVAAPPPWRPVFDGPGGRIWETPRALPLFFMPRHFRWTADAGESWQAVKDLEDFADLGVGVEVGEVGASGGVSPQEGNVPLIRPRSNGFDLAVASATGGTVASSVSYDPAWRIRVDGLPAPALDVDAGFLGFKVAAGTHQVAVDYRPLGWLLGLVLCGLASAAAVIGAALARARRRRLLLDEQPAAGRG